MPDFGYDVKLAVTVDGVKQEEMPTNPKISDDNYYKVEVECPNSDTMAEWDYNAWKLKLSYVESNSKCTLKFTSGMSKSDYDEYIKLGVALRRNTYRGKDITKYLEDGSLFTMIENGTFDDIYVGDYIISPTSKDNNNKKDVNGNTIKWLIADLDNFLYTGGGVDGKILTKHHATIIPSSGLTRAPMNKERTMEGGYANSDMVKSTLNDVLSIYIEPDFTKNGVSHVIEYNASLSSAFDSSRINEYGVATGASADNIWQLRKLDLMNEIAVFGTTVVSSSIYDVGIDSQQYAIFRLYPLSRWQDNATDKWYWLRDVVSSETFAYTSGPSASGHYNRPDDTTGCVRPRFLID